MRSACVRPDACRRITQAGNESSRRSAFAAAFPTPPKPRRVELDDEYGLRLLAEQRLAGAQDQHERAETSRDRWRSKVEYALAIRQLAGEALERFNDEFPRNPGTAWALYNACTEASDWRTGRGDQRDTILFGKRRDEKIRAYEAIATYL